ncbi:hypothetical protein BK126_03010 [Paenibacillus sp. FSL H7-0326]|uniref:P27 family phage terminase small subunit n=1 Tax=Paenibacillus sp. FSL H7-0326 TaxID=1921144 RepID=UPI00096CCD1A|nr:P27 family phage terminase small subunit [Paenibacillus sp. FSL H7-0326]OMC71097.1 hypothetical protein BK126_03010 [Paenibacillus sp. FSL H7-0326]
MAETNRDALRSMIETDLSAQLKDNKVTGHHFEDLLQDYLSLWDLKCKLIDDIKRNGIQVSGMHGPKSNPSIGDLHKTNDRMIKILDALGLKASPVEQDDGSKKKRSSNELI